MSDEAGILVGRIFFAVCSLVSLLAFIYVKKTVDLGYWYIKTFQFKNILKKPNVNHYRYSRLYFLTCFIMFAVLVFNPLFMESIPFIIVFFTTVFVFTAYFYWSLF